MKELKILALVFLVSAFSFPQSTSLSITNTIHFTADISGIMGVGIGGAFDPQSDSLLVMGFDWDDTTTVVNGSRNMVNTDPFNPGIYTTTLTIQSISDTLSWKFKASPDSRFRNDGLERGPDRLYYFGPDGSSITLPTVVPRIDPKFGQLLADLDLTIYVDMTGAINRYNGLFIPLNEIHFVGIKGTEDYLGSLEGGCWCVNDTLTGDMKVLRNFSNNLWIFNTTVPAGSEIGLVEYRLSAMYSGADTINGGVNPLDNADPFGANRYLIIYDTPSIEIFTQFTQYDAVEKLEELVPTFFQLEQNYPNPFNPSTKIRYSIPENSFVTLKVFNLLGEKIETLVNGEQSAGVYEATFDASKLSSGIYFYSLQTKNFTITKKMILVR